jgi:hypothetical protein
MLAVGLAMATSAYAENVCARNSTIGHAVLGGMNLSFAGLEAAAAAAAAGDLGAACDAVAAYYRTGNSTAWLRLPPVAAGTALHGGAVDAMVFNDTFGGFPSPPGPVQLTRNEDGGLQWQWWGPDHDDEFMNVMNRHAYFGTLLAAWNATGNGAYARFFGETASDWVLHLPCNRAVAAWANTSSTSTAAAAAVAAASAAAVSPCSPFGCTGSAAQCSAGRVCRWEQGAGGPCATGTFESPWRSLEMGIRGSLWPAAFFGFQQAPGFSTDARVLMLLGMAQHVAALLADGGHPGRGTVNWEMQQWSGLLTIAASFPELAGAQAAAAMALEYLSALLESGVYPDGVETEMASGYDMGTAGFYAKALQTAQQAAAVLPGIVPSASFAQRAQAMWDYGAYVVDPRGCLPQNGDSDVCGHGYSAEWAGAWSPPLPLMLLLLLLLLLLCGPASHSLAPSLPSLADFFNRDDWRYVHSNGAQGTPPSSPAHATPSVMFPWAGQAVLRSSYVRNATWVWFDVGPFGSNPFHAHKDKLQLMLHGKTAALLAVVCCFCGWGCRAHIVPSSPNSATATTTTTTSSTSTAAANNNNNSARIYPALRLWPLRLRRYLVLALAAAVRARDARAQHAAHRRQAAAAGARARRHAAPQQQLVLRAGAGRGAGQHEPVRRARGQRDALAHRAPPARRVAARCRRGRQRSRQPCAAGDVARAPELDGGAGRRRPRSRGWRRFCDEAAYRCAAARRARHGRGGAGLGQQLRRGRRA